MMPVFWLLACLLGDGILAQYEDDDDFFAYSDDAASEELMMPDSHIEEFAADPSTNDQDNRSPTQDDRSTTISSDIKNHSHTHRLPPASWSHDHGSSPLWRLLMPSSHPPIFITTESENESQKALFDLRTAKRMDDGKHKPPLPNYELWTWIIFGITMALGAVAFFLFLFRRWRANSASDGGESGANRKAKRKGKRRANRKAKQRASSGGNDGANRRVDSGAKSGTSSWSNLFGNRGSNSGEKSGANRWANLGANRSSTGHCHGPKEGPFRCEDPGGNSGGKTRAKHETKGESSGHCQGPKDGPFRCDG